MSIISLKDVSFGYGAEKALSDLSLEIPAGQITAILGPNGSGKTTLLHLMLGLLIPQTGQVWLDGQPQAHYTRRAMCQFIGLVPQLEYLPFNFSVLEYVLLGRTPHLGMLELPGERDYQTALSMLDMLGLTHLQARLVTELSGGERQMVILARSLSQQTRILLLDEPTSHLDLSNKGRILQVLHDLAEQGITVVFTTHDPEAVALIAHQLILMRGGQVQASGTVAQTLTTENLTATYGVPVQVISVAGRAVVLLANFVSYF